MFKEHTKRAISLHSLVLFVVQLGLLFCITITSILKSNLILKRIKTSYNLRLKIVITKLSSYGKIIAFVFHVLFSIKFSEK